MDTLIVVTCIVVLLAMLPLAWETLKHILPVVLNVVFWGAAVAVVVALVYAGVSQRPPVGDLDLDLVFQLLAVAVGIVTIVRVMLKRQS